MNWHWYLNHENVLLNITPGVMCAYLEAHGWKFMEPYGDAGKVYSLNENSPEIVVPASQQLSDYTLVLNEIVEILSKIEERDGLAILRDLSMAEFDLVRVRAPGAIGDGSISIDMGVTLFEQSRNMLLAAACSTSRPQPAFRAGSNREAVAYLQKVRLGQTEQGSFVVNLLSPVPSGPAVQTGSPSGLRGEPFARRVTHKLVSGLRAVRQAVDLAGRSLNRDVGVFEDMVEDGVSANLCDAVEKMLTSENSRENQGSLDISISWALTRPHPGGRAQVQFEGSDAPVLKEASLILKEWQEWPNGRIQGRVTSLARQEPKHEGRATIQAMIDGAMRPVRVVGLTDRDYSRIAEAHRVQQAISLRGNLRRGGRGWTLHDPRDLVVGDGDEVARIPRY